jgi:hypothetical protein
MSEGVTACIALASAGVVSKCDRRMFGGLLKNISEKQKKVLPFSSIFLSRLF